MRICVLGNSRSGHILRWVRHFVARGHEVHIVTISDNEAPGAIPHRLGFGAASLPRRLASYLRLAFGLRRVLNEVRPDLVQAHFAYTYGAAAAATGFHPTMLVTLGSDVLLPRLRDRAVRGLARYAVRHADLITGDSHGTVAASRALGARCPAHRLPYGVDLSRFAPQAARQEGQGFRLGIFKSLHPLYGHGVLVAAFAPVVAAHPDARLVIAGSGPVRARLERQAAALGIAANVDFLGLLPHERVPEVMQSLDAVALTSYSEGLPNMLLEGFASGLPAVATRVGGVPEIVREGATGYTVPPGDPAALARAIRRLIEEPEARREMGRRARALVEESYDCRDSVARMEALCLGLCGLAPERPAQTEGGALSADRPGQEKRRGPSGA